MIWDIESFTILARRWAPRATRRPTNAPPPKIVRKLVVAETSDNWETLSEVRIIVKTVIPVASLKAASVSIRVDSLRGSLALRKISSTVAVSVGEIIAAKRKEEVRGRLALCQRKSPPTTVAITTPIVASRRAGLATDLNSS